MYIYTPCGGQVYGIVINWPDMMNFLSLISWFILVVSFWEKYATIGMG